MFPILEMLRGGSGKSGDSGVWEITEIEQSILEGLLRIVLQRSWWGEASRFATLEFSLDGHETESQLLLILAP